MNELWKNILAELEMDPKIQGANFKTWFADTQLLSLENDHAVIGAKNSFITNTIKKKYLEHIKKAFRNNGKNPEIISFEVISTKKRKKQTEEIPAHSSKKPSVEDLIKKKTEKAKHSSGLNKDFTFDNFIVGGSNDLAFFASQNVAKNPGTKYNPLYFYGESGLGKTHLMQAIGNEIEKPFFILRLKTSIVIFWITCAQKSKVMLINIAMLMF